MLYLTCSCGEILGNKQIVYEERLKKVCEELSIDFEMVSQGLADKNEEYKKKRSEIINSICRRYCCKQAMITYVDLVGLIKG